MKVVSFRSTVIAFMCLIFFISIGNAQRSTGLGINYYIDSINGNDANTGFSEASAWQSLSNVNKTTFNPGDSILFRCGCTWSGITLHPLGSGFSGNPIVISKYGTGALPQINGNTAKSQTTQAVYLINQEYFTISDLDITNNYQSISTKTAVKYGIYILETNFGTAHRITLQNLLIHDVLGSYYSNVNAGGIFCNITGSSKVTIFDSLLIDHCKIYNVDRTGISNASSWSPGRSITNDKGWAPSTNLVVQYCEVDSSGANSIIIRESVAPKIQYNKIWKSSIRYSGNSIFVFDCDDALIQYNESACNVFNSGDADASAYDGDYRCHRTVIQYNYSHDNDGGAWVIVSDPAFSGTFDDSCIIRYNISQNDCHSNSSHANAICRIDGNITNTTIYNNVVYSSNDCINVINHCAWGGSPTATPQPDNTRYFNNIFQINKNTATFNFGASTNTTLDHNVFYYTPPYTGAYPQTDANVLTSNPSFVSPGSGASAYNPDITYNYHTLDGYKLQSGSPCINSGVNVAGYTSTDFWSNIVPGTTGKAPCRGAFEYTSAMPVTLISFKGDSKGRINQLNWATSEEINNKGFEVQHSRDGKIFTDLDFVATKTATGNYLGTINYSFTDASPYTGTNYYRLKAFDKQGKTTYSSVAALTNQKGLVPSISVYPNPIYKGNHLSLEIKNLPQGNYEAVVLDMKGNKIASETIAYNGVDGTIQLNTSTILITGAYLVQMTNGNFKVLTKVIIK